MPTTAIHHPPNPFATRFIRPGAISYLPPITTGSSNAALPDTTSGSTWLDDLLARWEATKYRGAIVGPHGCGKSTLLASLLPRLATANRDVAAVQLHDNERTLPADWPPPLVTANTILVIDGYEQLGWWSRWCVNRIVRRTGCGLIVTAHAKGWLPILYEVLPNEQTFRRVVAVLVGDNLIIPGEVLAEAWKVGQENIRESLFWLYDWWEGR